MQTSIILDSDCEIISYPSQQSTSSPKKQQKIKKSFKSSPSPIKIDLESDCEIIADNNFNGVLKLKHNYSKFLIESQNSIVENKDLKDLWPKYIGSIKKELILFPQFHNFEFETIDLEARISKIQCDYIEETKTYKTKEDSIFISFHYNNKMIGIIRKDSLVWNCLNSFNFITFKTTISENLDTILKINIDVFINKEIIDVILNPKIMNPLRKIKKIQEKKPKKHEISRYNKHISLLCKDALILLFKKMKITTSNTSLLMLSNLHIGDSIIYNESLELSIKKNFYHYYKLQFNKSDSFQIKNISSETRYSSFSILEPEKKKNINIETLNQINDSSFFYLSPTPKTMTIKLLDFQARALSWLLYREKKMSKIQLDPQNKINSKLGIFWNEYLLLDGTFLYVNVLNGKISLEFPDFLEVSGGILADEMGMGKTIMMIALMHSNRREKHIQDYIKKGRKKQKIEPKFQYKELGTLIITPLSILDQWKKEILNTSIPDSFKIIEYYGPKRNKIKINDFDIVLSTYETIVQEHKIKSKSRIFKKKWFRIILDEAHFIRNKNCNKSISCFDLQSVNRWCLTGTPMQNGIDDLFSLIRFLKVDIFSKYKFWNLFCKKHNNTFQIDDIFKHLTNNLILRRLKNNVENNELKITDKNYNTIQVELSIEERKLYDIYFNQSKSQFQSLLNNGLALTKIVHIFAILVKLRLFCDHPSFILKSVNQEESEQLAEQLVYEIAEKNHKIEEKTEIKKEFFSDVINTIKKNEFGECAICSQEMKDPTISKCCHIFCNLCFVKSINNNSNCPLCRTKLYLNDIKPVFIDLGSEFKVENSGSKLKCILNQIRLLIEQKEKVIIFSQFLQMIDLIENNLNREQIKNQKLTGKMNISSRSKSLELFSKDPEISCMLISLMAGSCGLNLISANNVILVDPWWNPAVETQAIQRVHRIGQTKTVNIYRFVCKNTIEERIIDVQDVKKKMISEIFDKDKTPPKKLNIEDLKRIFN